jgi:hypothetical protein
LFLLPPKNAFGGAITPLGNGTTNTLEEALEVEGDFNLEKFLASNCDGVSEVAAAVVVVVVVVVTVVMMDAA